VSWRLKFSGRLALYAFGIVLMWQAAGLFFARQHHDNILARGIHDDLAERIIGMSVSMFLWAAFTPLMLYLSDQFPLTRPRRFRNAAVIGLLAIAVAAVRALLDGWLPVVIDHLPLTLVDYSAGVVGTFHTHLLLALLLVGVGNFLRLEREESGRRHAEARLESELAEAKLRQLRADLQPHFLFNTLNGVATLVHQDPSRAEAVLRKLRDLLQVSVASERAREVRLEDELDFINSYFDIQKMRFAEKLQTAVVVSDEALRNAAVPPLLLQPLVENSIVHGITKRHGGGSVVVAVEREDDSTGAWLRMEIRDDGPGFDPLTASRKTSTGMPNARARLESLYGVRQSLRYHRRGDTFITEVRIPLRMVEP
jgi:two-component system, LytTR family, sensor kinase